MAAVTGLVLLTALATCSGLNIELKVQNDPQCKFKGQQCSSDLKHVIYCTARKGNSYVVTTCPKGTTCGEDANGKYACSSGIPDFPEVPKRNDTIFTCDGEGGFPDGYYCNKGYLCSSKGSFPDMVCECPAGTAMLFFPNFTCVSDEGLKEDCGCPYMDRCKHSWNPGQFGVSCNPEHFYTCQGDAKDGFTVQVHKCPEGQQFLDGMCRTPTAGLGLLNGSNVSSEEPVCKPFTPPCLPEAGVKCSRKGEMLPHKVKRCYYYCDSGLKPNIRDCGKGSYFTCKHGHCGCVYDPNRQ